MFFSTLFLFFIYKNCECTGVITALDGYLQINHTGKALQDTTLDTSSTHKRQSIKSFCNTSSDLFCKWRPRVCMPQGLWEIGVVLVDLLFCSYRCRLCRELSALFLVFRQRAPIVLHGSACGWPRPPELCVPSPTSGLSFTMTNPGARHCGKS